MKIKAYILTADPAWIERSVLSYYEIVDEIIVSFDRSHRGWTGAPIPVKECLERLQAIDHAGKMRMCPGDYSNFKGDPMKGETIQRQQCLAEAGDADWVLQIDTDEVLPNQDLFLEMLEYAAERRITAVEWPMRVFFQRLKDGRFLEVCESKRTGHYEYPGPIAVRPDVTLACARRTDGQFLRAVVVGDQRSLQVRRRPEANEFRVDCCKENDAILHFSWVRTPQEIRSKIASWGHNEGLKSWLFYHVYWKSAPTLWRWLHDFHPFARGLWPALRPVPERVALLNGV